MAENKFDYDPRIRNRFLRLLPKRFELGICNFDEMCQVNKTSNNVIMNIKFYFDTKYYTSYRNFQY